MSDIHSQSSPDGESNRHGNLPAPRSKQDPPASGEEPPAQISLEEMMERLQRSGRKSSGESRSAESGSGRRRRSSSSSRSSPSESPRGWGSDRAQPLENESNAGPVEAASKGTLTRAVLPPPRQTGRSATPPARPRKPSNTLRSRTWLLILIGLLLLAGLTWIGISKMNRWRIEGDGFSVNAARRISELVGRRVAFSRFKQTGSDQLSNAVVSITPIYPDLVDTISLEQLNGEFAAGSWLADDWTLRSLRIRKTDITFQPKKVVDYNTQSRSPVDRGIKPGQSFRLSMTSDPTNVILETGRLDQVNLTWPGPDGAPESLTGLEGSFLVSDQTVKLQFIHGVLDTAGWPAFPVHQISAQLRGTSLQIISARLGIIPEHNINVTGSAELVPDGNLKLNATFDPLLLKHILPDAWSSSALGTFQTKNATWLSHFSGGTVPPPAPATFSGAFTVKGFVLRSLPFLEKIATLLRTPNLTMIEFPNLDGDFSWTPEVTQLSNLTASTQDGLVRLKANLSAVPGGNVTGEITVEANEAYFAGLPNDDSNHFTKDSDDWRSITFKIHGSADSTLADNIGIAQPIIIQNRPNPSGGMPRMTLPPGTALPPPAAPAAPVRAPLRAIPAPPRAPAPRAPASDKELENQLKELLENAKSSPKTSPQLPTEN